MKTLAIQRSLFFGLLLWQSPLWAAVTEGPPVPPSPLGGETILQVLMGLGLVLVAVVFCAWLMRRLLRIQPGANGQMRILGGLSMGTRERVVLLEVGETQLLLGVAPGRIETLHVLEQPIQVAELKTHEGFSKQLGDALGKLRGQDVS